MSVNADQKAAAKARMEKLKDVAYDPYTDPNYVRPEFALVADTKASTIASEYKQGKASNLIYEAKLSEKGLDCRFLCNSLGNLASCSYCNRQILKKYAFHRIYDDHVETNIPSSFCCWIVDNTQVFYFDRDWATDFQKAGICTPVCTHCGGGWDCFGLFGSTAIGFGATNGECCPGGRRIGVPITICQNSGGPMLFGCCPIGNAQYAFFAHVDPASVDEFVEKLKAQRAQIKAQHNVEVGKAGLQQVAAADQSRE